MILTQATCSMQVPYLGVPFNDMWTTGLGTDQEFSLGSITFEMLRKQLAI